MLATRYRDTGRDHWTRSKYESSADKIPQQRMSDSYATSFVTQSEWQGHFGYPQPHGSGTLPPSLERTHDPSDLGYQRSAMEEERAKREAQVTEDEPPPPYADAFQATGVDNRTSARRISEGHASIDIASEPPKASVHLDDRKSPLDTSNRVGESAEQRSDQCGTSASEDQSLMIKDEEDDGIYEEEEGGGGHINRPQTAAERSAARRKMKRFRYDRKFHSTDQTSNR